MNCFIFAGQGSQYPKMGYDFWEHSQVFKRSLEEASDLLKQNIETLLFDSSEEELKQTINTQIAVTVMNVAILAVLNDKGFQSDMSAGFSLGEFTALYDARILKLPDLYALVATRARLMQRAAKEWEDKHIAMGMMAVVGLTENQIEEVFRENTHESVYVANYNSPTQFVLSGKKENLMKLGDILKQKGARHCLFLKVSAPFHTPLVQSAVEDFTRAVQKTTFHNPKKILFSNASGEKIVSLEQAKNLVIKQLVSPVLWSSICGRIADEKPNSLIEVGPGGILTKLWNPYRLDLKCRPCGTWSEYLSLSHQGEM